MNSGKVLWACDTSVAIPALDPNHPAHEECRSVVIERSPALSGHAAIETYAVLTRLPLPSRVSPSVAGELIDRVFGEPCWPSPETMMGYLAELPSSGIVGGESYDALVAAAAMSTNRRLLTRDSRADRTYRAVGVTFELLAG